MKGQTVSLPLLTTCRHDLGKYLDVKDYSTNESTMDGTASAILLWGVKEFAQVSQLEKSELFEALLRLSKTQAFPGDPCLPNCLNQYRQCNEPSYIQKSSFQLFLPGRTHSRNK